MGPRNISLNMMVEEEEEEEELQRSVGVGRKEVEGWLTTEAKRSWK